jgi:hypothetical protein
MLGPNVILTLVFCFQILRRETAAVGKTANETLADIDINTVIGPSPQDSLIDAPDCGSTPVADGPLIDTEQILTCNVNTLTVTCENLKHQLNRQSDVESLLNTVSAGVAALAGADPEGTAGLIWKEKKLGRMTILNQELCNRIAGLDAELRAKDATIEQLMAVQSHTASEKAVLIAERAAAVDAASEKSNALGAVERQLALAKSRLHVSVKMSSVLALGLLATSDGSQCDETHALEFVGKMFVDSLKAMTELNKYSTRIQRVARGHQVRRVASSLLASAGVRVPSEITVSHHHAFFSFFLGSVSTFVLDQPGALPPSPILERLLPLAWCLSRVDADSSRCSRCRSLHTHKICVNSHILYYFLTFPPPEQPSSRIARLALRPPPQRPRPSALSIGLVLIPTAARLRPAVGCFHTRRIKGYSR